MKQIRYIVCLFASCLLMAACSSHRAEKAWIEQGESLKDSLPDSALVVLQKVKLPESLGDRWLARWCMAYGDAADKIYADLPYSSQLEQAVKWAKRHGSRLEKARLGLFYGRSLAAENQNDEATKVYLSTLDQAIKDKEYDQAGYIDSYLGDLYNDKEEYEKARLKYEESSKYFKLANNLGSYSNSLKDVGKMYAFSDSFQQALSMIQKAKEVAENLNDSARIPSMYNGLANIYSMMNEDSVAERYIRQSVAMERTDKAPDYSALAEIQLKMGRDAEAEKSLEEATKYVGDNPYTQISIASEYYNLAKIRGNYKQALEYKERRDQIVDSIRRIQNKSHILEVEKRYEHQQILADAMRLQVTSQRYFSAMLLFLFLCLLIGFIHIIRVRKKERKIHEQQQQLLEDENHLLHLSEELRQKEEELQKLREENSEQWGPLIADIRRLKAEKLQFTPIYRTLVKLIKMFTPDSQSLSDANWKDIHATVDAAFESFYRNLHQTYPDVSEKEIDYCYLQFFNFKIKEESILLSITPDSVKKLRIRIRQHLGIVGEKQDLRELLLSLSTISPLAKL